MIQSGEEPCFNIIIQEEGCDQWVKNSWMFLLIDRILEKLLWRKCSYGQDKRTVEKSSL